MDDVVQLITDLFGLYTEPRDLSVFQIFARALLIFVSALVMLRVAHKRFFARRNALDVLLTLVIASTLARGINGSAALFPTIVVGFVLVLVHRGLVRLASRWPSLERLVKGSPVVLLEDGEMKRHALGSHALTEHDIHEDLRLNGVEKPAGVRLATLERNGEVSVVKRDCGKRVSGEGVRDKGMTE